MPSYLFGQSFLYYRARPHTPVLVDSAPGSYNTSLSEIKKRVTNKTKLIQLTHAAGEPVNDIHEISKFAKKKDQIIRGL